MLSALTLAEDGEVLRLVRREETVRVPVVVGARERRHHDAGRKGDGAVRAEEQRPHEPRIAAAKHRDADVRRPRGPGVITQM